MTPADAESLFAINSNPDVMRFTGESPLRSVDEARAAIERYPDFETVGYGRWGCYLKSTRSLIGFCGLKYLDELGCVDVGFRFLPQYWGQGLATEACSASLAFGFDVLGLDRIVGIVLPDNKASIRVLEKCGLHRRGPITTEGHEAWLYEVRR